MAEYVCEISYEGNGGNHGTFARKERVVRCRDCEYCFARDRAGVCCTRVWDPTTEDCQPVEPEGLCSWGKERGA